MQANHKYVSSGEKYGALPTPSKNNLLFLGWLTAKTDGEKISEESVYSESKLYAVWEENIADSDVMLGDVDGNGMIDTTDYMRVKTAFLGTFKLSEGEFIAADVDKNGVIDTTDYMRIKAHFLGTYVIE